MPGGGWRRGEGSVRARRGTAGHSQVRERQGKKSKHGQPGGEAQGERKPGIARQCSSVEMRLAQNDWVVPRFTCGFRLSAQKA